MYPKLWCVCLVCERETEKWRPSLGINTHWVTETEEYLLILISMYNEIPGSFSQEEKKTRLRS